MCQIEVREGRKWDHSRVKLWFIDHYMARVGPEATAVYLALTKFIDDEQHCFPSLTTLQKLTGLSRPTICRRLRILEEFQLIAREEHRGQHTIYTLLSPKELPTSKPDEPVNAVNQLTAFTTTSKRSLPVPVNAVNSLPPHPQPLNQPMEPPPPISPPSGEGTPVLFGKSPEQDSVAQGVRKKARTQPALTAPTWEAYRGAYLATYKVEPVRNARVNAQLGQLVARLGCKDAPEVASWFLAHRGAWYVQQGHSVGALLRDCEKLHTEWLNGVTIHQRDAREVDRVSANEAMWKRIEARQEARKGAQG